MKSMHLTNGGDGPVLVEKDVLPSKPKAGEVLIRVHAAGITTTEPAWYPTWHNRNGEERTGAVPSHEFSGEIAEMCEAVEGLSAGEEVYGMNDWFADGALAEYCITEPGWIAAKPRRISHAEAASVPISALTAWQGLFERANLQAGERILVHGGSGAVGVFVIQLARLHGAHVIATVSARNLEYVKELGADEAIDYNAGCFEDEVRDVDVVFDTVGSQVLQRSWKVLKKNGRLVTIAADSEGTSDERIKQAFFIVEPSRHLLMKIGRLIDAGDLRPIVDRILPFAQAGEAFAGRAERSGRGKLVVAVATTASGPPI